MAAHSQTISNRFGCAATLVLAAYSPNLLGQASSQLAQSIRDLSRSCGHSAAGELSIITMRNSNGESAIYYRNNYKATSRYDSGGFLREDSVRAQEIELDRSLENFSIRYIAKITAAKDKTQTYREIAITVSGRMADVIVRRSRDQQIPQVVFECKNQSSCMRINDTFESITNLANTVGRFVERTEILREAELKRSEADWDAENKKLESAMDKTAVMRLAGNSALVSFNCNTTVGAQIIDAANKR